ncbi:MAG: thioredoxin fold domain-containing protein [Acidiferrobacteraceae bacterium]
MSPLEFGAGRSLIYVVLAMIAASHPVWAAGDPTGGPVEKHGSETTGRLARVFKQLRRAGWITEGRSSRIMYVFFDPNCPYCHILYDVSQRFVRAGLVEMRWIPVGMLAPSSTGKAAAILAARDRRAAFEQNEDHYRRPGGGGIAPVRPSRSIEAQLRTNLELFQKAGGEGVPLILWEDHSGRIGMQDGAVDKETLAYLIHQIRPRH